MEMSVLKIFPFCCSIGLVRKFKLEQKTATTVAVFCSNATSIHNFVYKLPLQKKLQAILKVHLLQTEHQVPAGEVTQLWALSAGVMQYVRLHRISVHLGVETYLHVWTFSPSSQGHVQRPDGRV